MNIYYLSRVAQECAPLVDNSRLVTLAKEGLQIINTAARANGVGNMPYKPAHANHPVVVANTQNYTLFLWTIDYTRAMIDECQHRGYKTDKLRSVYDETMAVLIETNHIDPMTGHQELTILPTNLDQANCAAHSGLGIDYRSTHPVDLAYREYYTHRILYRTYVDHRPTKWTNRPVPGFIREHNEPLWEVLMTFQIN